MPKFITTAEISCQVERIISDAKSHIVLISPYLRVNKRLQQLLVEKSKEVLIVIIYGKDDLKETEKKMD